MRRTLPRHFLGSVHFRVAIPVHAENMAETFPPCLLHLIDDVVDIDAFQPHSQDSYETLSLKTYESTLYLLVGPPFSEAYLVLNGRRICTFPSHIVHFCAVSEVLS